MIKHRLYHDLELETCLILIYFLVLIWENKDAEKRILDMKAKSVQNPNLVNVKKRSLLLQTNFFTFCHRMAHKHAGDGFSVNASRKLIAMPVEMLAKCAE
jgi:hypothetical protein